MRGRALFVTGIKMMKPIFKLALAIAIALGSSQALALQLGQIQVKSALDEPLVAEIPVQLDNLAEAQGLSVALASDADFTRAGLSRAGLGDLRFSVITDSTGHKLVLVTSDQPIADPYLDFLVQIDTRKGKQLREYTVLLDPVIAATPPVQTESAETETPIAQPVPTPAPVQQPAPMPVPAPAPARQPPGTPHPFASVPPKAPPSRPISAPSAPSAPRSGEYTVRNGDTLYRVARQVRPDAGVSLDQMMLALQKTNPDAFYRDNINALKSGAILRIPPRDVITAHSIAEAQAQVHRQYDDWRGTTARKATTVVENNAVPSVPPANAGAKSSDASDRLALVPPAQAGGSAASRPGEKGGTGNATVSGLKQQLATAKESLSSAKQENADLQSRAKDLEDISNKNQKLLGMKDAEIAQLQRKLAEAQQQSAKPVAASTASVPVVAGAGSTAAVTPAGSVASSSSTAPAPAATSGAAPLTSTSTNATRAPVTKQAVSNASAKPAITRTPEPVEGLPWYRRPLSWIIAAVVIFALILLGLMRKRPRQLPEPDEMSPSLADHGDSPLAAPDDAAIEDAHEQSLEATGHASPDELDAPAADIAGESAAHEAEDRYGFTFDEPPPGEPVAEPGMAPPPLPVAGEDDIIRQHVVPGLDDGLDDKPAYRLPVLFDGERDTATREHPVPAFSDDPVDTKLDLARAYLDMGDPAGARAMLEEVINEGSQMQQDEARRLLEGLA